MELNWEPKLRRVAKARRATRTLKLGHVFLLLSSFLPLTRPVSAIPASTIVVNDLTDKSTSVFDAIIDDGKCQLREAIQAANTDAPVNTNDCPAGSGADTITFSSSGTINLKGGGVSDD